jgi:hypothetical protein
METHLGGKNRSRFTYRISRVKNDSLVAEQCRFFLDRLLRKNVQGERKNNPVLIMLYMKKIDTESSENVVRLMTCCCVFSSAKRRFDVLRSCRNKLLEGAQRGGKNEQKWFRREFDSEPGSYRASSNVLSSITIRFSSGVLFFSSKVGSAGVTMSSLLDGCFKAISH